MDEHFNAEESKRTMKLRKDARITSIAALAFGSGMLLVAIGIWVFFADLFRAALDPRTSNLASALWWFIFVLVACNGMSVITAVSTLRYLRAEQNASA